jgi:hypothetical protein
MILHSILYTIPVISQLETVMRHVLDWFHSKLGLSWAWSIVATTVVVRMLLVPLTIRQIHSMQSLQKHAPQMKEIQKKYKHDRQKQNEELMKFYRENKINPAASCLPMLAQLPVFIALLHAEALQVREGGRPLVPPLHSVDLGAHDDALGWLRAPPRVRGESDGLDLLHGGDDGQDPADAVPDPADLLRLRHRPLPGRSRSLLGDDEPLDGRAGPDHKAARRANPGTGFGEAQLADSAEGRRLERQRRPQ